MIIDLNDLPQQLNDEKVINYKRLFFLLLQKWYWLILITFLGAGGGYLYGKFTPQTYKIDSSIIVPEDKNALNLGSLFENDMPGLGKVTINNEIELLKSYTLNHRVVDNLNWRTAWYEKDFLIWKGLYTQEPFQVQEINNGLNAEGVYLTLSPKGDGRYQLEADGTGLINNQEVEVNFSETITLGQAFRNEYFNFTLHLKEGVGALDDKEYRFVFQNSNKQTFNYLKQIQVSQADKQGEVIRLTLEGSEPLRNIHYLNELIRVYLDLKLEQQTQTQKRSLEFIDKQLSGISDSLHVAGTTFTEFRSRNQIIDLSAQGTMVMEQLGEIERQKSQQQIQLEYFRNLLSYLEKGENINQMSTPSVVGIEDPSLNALVLKLGDLYSRREILSFSAYESNPTLVLLNKEIRQVNEQLRENLLNLIDNAQISIASLETRQNRINSDLNNLPGQEQQLINIQRQYQLTSEIYTFLLQKRAEIEIALAAAVVDIQIIDPARMERIIPTGRSILILLLFGAFLGFLLPVVVILLSDQLNSKIHLQEDVEKLTSLTIVGNVLHSREKSELVVMEHPTAPISESYRTIRTNLQYKFKEPGEKVIGIHSISPGEGKTFTSTNLASILAMNEKKTLLIGADMRKPRLHQIFQVDNQLGLSNYLVGQTSAKEIVKESLIDNLFIIPSGPVPPNPAELLERKRLQELIDWAKSEFDYIIFDNAPVSMVTDGLITSQLSDLNLFILRYGVSDKDQLKFINEMTKKGTMPNAALVINDIKLSGYGYSYSYKYAYGKGYYAE
ncbi:polysaccharide biosynthesis tyrosine autokinase [uncultured Sunxiuqinia sp.]|uniref:GumC family protein n=1 Tax=uncultured Sunxiuqinia sp. TaxID=1573825 RepID=UPI0026307CE6|nr:polysaccharide biosynthesis tyrosine autokinase [uncultured Sunxiuqinia sp.]